MSIKILNSLSHNLADSYFSTNNYYDKGYMVDWLVNGANELGVNFVEIDVLNKTISPRELMDTPLMAFMNYTNSIIERTLISLNKPRDFITEAKLLINIHPDRWISCDNYSKDTSGKLYKSRDYKDKSTAVFKVFDKHYKWLGSKHSSSLISSIKSFLRIK
jgi:hypothetical protein